ncbi:MAG: hypothetical protein IJW49_01465 [Clostridia bacterium]|nr:hypothetical protein [Clostridia bacterium]
MGVIFAIVLFILLLMVGITGIIAGIIGLVICRKKRKTGNPIPKVLTVVFAVVLSIGIVITLIPIGFFSFIVYINSMPPDGFVETAIVIEEDGYQDTRFTADGVVYEVLDFEVYDTEAISNPIFTYKTDGFLNGSQCGNYYAIENSQGFNLVSNEFGLLFCPVEERESVIAYYTDIDNLCGYYDDWNKREFKLSDQEMETVRDFLNTDTSLLHQEQVVLDDAEQFEIKLVCKEGLVNVESYWFLILNGELYYVYESDFAEEDGLQYTLFELPNAVADALFTIHQKN